MDLGWLMISKTPTQTPVFILSLPVQVVGGCIIARIDQALAFLGFKGKDRLATSYQPH
jgi:hypothetical protein